MCITSWSTPLRSCIGKIWIYCSNWGEFVERTGSTRAACFRTIVTSTWFTNVRKVAAI